MSVRVTTAGQIACDSHYFGLAPVVNKSRSRRAKLVAVATKRGSGLGRVCQRHSPCVGVSRPFAAVPDKRTRGGSGNEPSSYDRSMQELRKVLKDFGALGVVDSPRGGLLVLVMECFRRVRVAGGRVAGSS